MDKLTLPQYILFICHPRQSLILREGMSCISVLFTVKLFLMLALYTDIFTIINKYI